jgi:tetratricopeptide (TPR) repeat protein
MAMPSLRMFVSLVVVLSCLAGSLAGADDPGLLAARQNFAEHYFNAEAHLRLALFLAEHGQRLTGFFVSESARRTEFDEETFKRAVQAVYHRDDFQNGPEAEQALIRELASKPDVAKTHDRLADLYLSRGNWKKAEAELRKAIALDPESYDFVGGLAEVLRRDHRETEGAALEEKWLKIHPKSLAAYSRKIESLQKSDPMAAGAMAIEALKAFPESGQLHYTYAAILHESATLPEAAEEFEKAASLAPRSAFIQGWTARFFLKAMKDPEKSLRYYLNAYFIDPDFYDSEFAEGRIRSIGTALGSAHYQAERAAGKTAPDLLDSNDPYVVLLALQEAEKSWSPEVQTHVVALLQHDDDSIRYGAATLLGQKADASFDEELHRLLQSPDLRVRGTAAYIAGDRWKEKVVPILTPWLDEKADLILYDAVSVLLQSGGESGKTVLRKFRDSAAAKAPRLAAILDTIDRPVKKE